MVSTISRLLFRLMLTRDVDVGSELEAIVGQTDLSTDAEKRTGQIVSLALVDCHRGILLSQAPGISLCA